MENNPSRSCSERVSLPAEIDRPPASSCLYADQDKDKFNSTSHIGTINFYVIKPPTNLPCASRTQSRLRLLDSRSEVVRLNLSIV